jgi:hypothetical protein
MSLIKRFLRWLDEGRREEWRRVPPPVWAAKRGGRDYW